MMDWFVILTPLLVLPAVLLLAFLGCAAGAVSGGPRSRHPVWFRLSADRTQVPAADFDRVIFRWRPSPESDFGVHTLLAPTGTDGSLDLFTHEVDTDPRDEVWTLTAEYFYFSDAGLTVIRGTCHGFIPGVYGDSGAEFRVVRDGASGFRVENVSCPPPG